MKLVTALEKLEFFAFHGIYAEEKTIGGKFTLDIWIEQDVPDEIEFKKINEVLDYEKIYAIVKNEMNQPKDLIEEVAKNILDKIELQNADLVSIKIKITKHNPAGKFEKGDASVMLEKIFN